MKHPHLLVGLSILFVFAFCDGSCLQLPSFCDKTLPQTQRLDAPYAHYIFEVARGIAKRSLEEVDDALELFVSFF